MVLEELRREAQKCIQHKHQSAIGLPSTDQQVTNNINIGLNESRRIDIPGEHFNYGPASFPQPTFEGIRRNTDGVSPSLTLSNIQSEAWMENLMQDGSPGTYIPSLTSWGEFDSLALTGLGELGYLFASNNLQTFEG